jgi:hypothetical protein
MALKDRIYGYTLSDLERELVFRRENIGFVRRIHSSGQICYLDPSPFLRTPKREIYVSPTPLPEGRLVEVTVEREEMDRWRDGAGPYNLIVKIIGNWKELRPEEVVHVRQRIVSQQDIVQYFSLPYYGEEECIEQIATCSLLYTLSSPPVGPECGGIHAAVLGRPKEWVGFRRSVSPIPRELRKPSSRYFYDIADTEAKRRAGSHREVSLAYLKPKRTPMHVPIVLEEVDVRPPRTFGLDVDSLAPYMTGILLDAIATEPEIAPGLDHQITEATYRVINDFRGAGRLPYKQDFGAAIPRLSLAVTRLSIVCGGTSEIGSKEITTAINLWENMLYRAKRSLTAPTKLEILYELDNPSRKLYHALLDAFPIDTLIPTSEIDAVGIAVFNNYDNFIEAKQRLNHWGLIIYLGKFTKILSNL